MLSRRVRGAGRSRCSTGSTALGVAAALAVGAAARRCCFAFFVVGCERQSGGRRHRAQPPRRRAHRRRLSRRLRRHRRGADRSPARRRCRSRCCAACRSSGRRSSTRPLLGYAAFAAGALRRRLALARTLARPAAAHGRREPLRPRRRRASRCARTRIAALVCCGALAAAGGAYLARRLRQHVRRGHVGRPRLHRPGDRHRRPPRRRRRAARGAVLRLRHRAAVPLPGARPRTCRSSSSSSCRTC